MKKFYAVILSVIMACSAFTACGVADDDEDSKGIPAVALESSSEADESADEESSDNDSEEESEADNSDSESSAYVNESQAVEKVLTGEDSAIVYLGTTDINPTSLELKSTELELFEAKGGTIEFHQTTSTAKYDDLASAILSKNNTPDIFKYDWLDFPSKVALDFYQPVDDIVDFNSELWSDTKELADGYAIDGKHYVAPLSYQASAFMCYDADVIEAEGLTSPYELYLNGEWNWNTCEEIMNEYVSSAPADTQRYGVNGFFQMHVVQQTGKTLVSYNAETNKFTSNLYDDDIARAQDFLHRISGSGLVLGTWIGNARDCFEKNCLFYAMGLWAYTGSVTPEEGEHWEIVPIPQDPDNPQKITSIDMTAYMWVNGSTKSEAVKTWFECVRLANTDSEYKQAEKENFFYENPNWTEEMYNVTQDVISNDYTKIFDYAYGVSTDLGDSEGFDGYRSLTQYLYELPQNEDGSFPEWDSIRDEYADRVESNVSSINEQINDYKKQKS